MGFQRFFAAQLRRPSGWFGSLVMSRALNRVNAKIVHGTLAALAIEPAHSVLEIGFGGGAALALASRMARDGMVAGLDLSPEMVRGAERKFARQVASGRMLLQLGDVADLPFGDAVFDRAFTINTIYFWSDPPRALSEIYRVLKPGGRAAIGLRSREKMQRSGVVKFGFRLFEPAEVVELMGAAGFGAITCEHRDRGKAWDEAIVVGRR